MSGKKQVLIVDDDQQNLRLLLEILKNDYSVLVAKDGNTALEIASQDLAPDIILLDINMPRFNGFDVLEELKNNSKTRDIPVVMVSGEEDKEIIDRAKQLHAVDYLFKTVDPQLVLQTVARYI